MAAFETFPIVKKTFPWPLALIFLLFSVAIVLTGAFYYESQKKRVYSEQEENLAAIASLKIAQIVRWHKERLGDATVIRDNKSLIKSIEKYFNNGNLKLKSDLLFWMNSINKKSDYRSFLITDTLLNVRLSVLSSDSLPGEYLKDELKTVLESHSIIMTDLHRSEYLPFIHIDMLVPLLDSVNNKLLTVGVAIIRIDPNNDLFPLIQSWPNSSKSSETLLLRKEGDSVLYLNELRHVKNSAMNLKFAMSKKNLLATIAANGFEGIAEGIDYRNIRVIGSLHKIPDLPWYMVAKVDSDEILSPLKRLVIMIISIVVLLILINASVFGFWIWQQRLKSYRQQIKDETAIRESVEHLRETNEYLSNLFNYANAPIIVWDNLLNITRFNHAFENLSGYSAHEVTGKKIDILFSKEKSESSLIEINRAIGGDRWETVEIEIKRKDGDSRIVLWNSANIHDKDGKTVIATIAQGQDITKRKEVEEQLRENEKRLREAQEMSHLGFWLWDIKTGDVEWSDEVYKIFRLDPALFNPNINSILDMSPWPEDNKRDKELISRAIETHDVGTYEQKFLRPDQSIGYYYSTFRGNYDGNDGLISIVGTVLDITEQKLAEEALRESEDKFKYVFDHSVIGKSITFPDGEIHVNQSFCDMLGYSHEELEKTKWQDISLQDDIDLTQKNLNLLLTGEKSSVRFIKRYIHKNGNTVWADVGTALRRTPDGKPLYFMTAINDITENKRVEAELRLQSEIMSHITEAVYLVRLDDGIIVYTNSRFEELFGYSDGEMVGKTVSIVNAPTEKSPEEIAVKIIKELEENGFWTGEVLNIKKDGTIFWTHANVTIFDHTKFGKVLVSVQEDISVRKDGEFLIKKLNEELEGRVVMRTQQLEAVNKELEAFTYSVSHDLRAPLRAVHGYTKILLEEYEDKLDDEGKRICGIISSSATQMGELIDDLLSFSRIGRSRLNPSEIDMKKMAMVVLEGMTSPAESKRIKLKIGRLPKAFGDVTLFGQVWTNLISNAIKYSSKMDISEITIGSEADGKMITYFIKDNGVGFDMQYAHKLFGVFQRLHSEAEFEGNGVGLAIVQRIILKHAGKVWAKSEVGKGATFYFSLPVNGAGSTEN
jgi:PAS domain S-box-containing protein